MSDQKQMEQSAAVAPQAKEEAKRGIARQALADENNQHNRRSPAADS